MARRVDRRRPVRDVPVQPTTVERPLITQTRLRRATRSVYVTHVHCARASLVDHRLRLGRGDVEGGLPDRDAAGLADGRGPDRMGCAVGRTGALARLRRADRTAAVQRPFGGMLVRSTGMLGARLYEGARHGFAVAAPAASARRCGCRAAGAYTSFADKQHGWQSREHGVFSTSDGGKTWRRIYPRYAQRRAATLVASGCDQRRRPRGVQLRRSSNSGPMTTVVSWHETKALTASFTGGGSDDLSPGTATRSGAQRGRRVRSRTIKTFDDADRRCRGRSERRRRAAHPAGQDWDDAARLAVIRDGSATTRRSLPDEVGGSRPARSW